MTVIEVKTEEQFYELVNDTSKTTFVDFYATWCGPCKVISPVFNQLSQQHTSDAAQFAKVDVDVLEKVSAEANIQAMPTFHAYKGGKVQAEMRGADKVKLEKLVKKELGLLPVEAPKALVKGQVNETKSVEEWNTALKEKTVFVDFFAEWCGPCKIIHPKVVQWAKEYPSILFVELDVDELSEVAEPAGVTAMPTFHVYVDGKKVDETIGAVPAKIQALLNKYSDAPSDAAPSDAPSSL